jgi:hypothetical protein
MEYDTQHFQIDHGTLDWTWKTIPVTMRLDEFSPPALANTVRALPGRKAQLADEV